ncbi:MAG: AraC family transcriptional regulator [Gammaproteobacteria bacterium]|nr:AraC family transcriptional regulator [Gammaproteobacteria bacterium]
MSRSQKLKVPPSSKLPEFLFGREMSTPVRLAYGLAPMIQFLENTGHAVEPLLAATEIPRFALEEPSYRISLEQKLKFTRLVLARVKSASAALEIGRRFHLSMFSVLGLTASCAPTIRDSLQLLLTYPELAWGLIELVVWREGEHKYIAFEPGPVVRELGPFFVERDSIAILNLFRNLVGTHLVAHAVAFRHRAPKDSRLYDAFFGCPVEFGAKINEMSFESRVWDTPPLQANAMSRRFFENQCRRLSEMMQEPFKFSDIVRSRLRSATPIPALPMLARALHMTARTLQRRLALETTDFSSVLREVRIQRATELMHRSHLHLEEVAYRLGFHDPDAFSRAFRTWTGLSPTEFRRR